VSESPHGDAANDQRMAMSSFHGETVSEWRGSHPTTRQRADGEGAIPRRDSERMTREPYHDETVSGQRTVREPSHGDTGNVQRIVRILVLTRDRACSGAANFWADERRDLRRRATECGVWTSDIVIETERRRNCLVRCKVLGSSSVRTEPEEVNVQEQTYL
jgi:hypothetical protein